ncbi:CHAT domain-containing protein [Aliikangiella coralliicola]|uniref:CHAT domain-containing protein n=1 Tax=Aliikangiella coralliicola TaxID=2592383 RepID=A0A545U0F1_9GAMM|nr:CHAT domain-containing tetratricopeptide repeat protein [Aliikangiella coralliicola]TQV82946.1 CHAT domain-containing protein [Aliikangiella coralliicola]
MKKISFSLLLLFCFSVFAVSGEACPHAPRGKPLREVKLETPNESNLLVSIIPRNTKLVTLLIHSKGKNWYRNPLGNNVKQVIFIDKNKIQSEATLCIYSQYSNSGKSIEGISFEKIKEIRGSVRESLLLLNEASSLWHKNDKHSKLNSISAYATLFENNTREFDLSLLAFLNLLEANFNLYNYDEVFRLYKVLPTRLKLNEYFYYHVLRIKAKALVRQHKLHEALPVAENALLTLELYVKKHKYSFRADEAEIRNLIGEILLSQSRGLVGNTAYKKMHHGKLFLDKAYMFAIGNSQLLAHIHNNKGLYHILKSRIVTREVRLEELLISIGEHERAKEYAVSANDNFSLPLIENNLGSLYLKTRQLGKSLRSYQSALSRIDNEKESELLALLYKNLGKVYQSLGDYSKSEAFLSKAVSLSEKASTIEVANIKCIQGTTLRLMGEVLKARRLHESCLELLKVESEESVENDIVNARLQLAEDHLINGNGSESKAQVMLAMNELNMITSFDLKAQLLIQFSRMLDADGKQSQAINAIHEAIESSKKAQLPASYIDSLEFAINYFKSINKFQELNNYGELALKEIEYLHEQLDSERLGPAWSNKTNAIYMTLADVRLSQYRDNESEEGLALIFNLIERSKAISLRLSIASDKANSSLKEMNDKADYISEIAKEEAVSKTKEQRKKLMVERFHEQEINTYGRMSERTKSKLPPLIELVKAREKLSEKQMVIYYLLLSENIIAFTLTRNDANVQLIGHADEIFETHSSTRDILTSKNLIKTYQHLDKISSKLIKPINIGKHISELLFVPHLSLHSIPFSALSNSKVAGKYEPLIENYTVKVIPSLNTYLMKKNKIDYEFSKYLAVIANPVFSKSNKLAKDESNDKSETFRSWSRELKPLPYTHIESEKLKELLNDNAIVFGQEKATRQNLYSDVARRAKILHISTHGYFRESNSDNVGLALSIVDEFGNSIPGFVTVTDLFNNEFLNELVVINGCDTAMGEPQAGEGITGLTRGFLAQGAKHVISTLWPVTDKASAKFMEYFYGHLIKEGDISKALRLAQSQLRKNRKYRDPFYWAPYILTTVSPDENIILRRK